MNIVRKKNKSVPFFAFLFFLILPLLIIDQLSKFIVLRNFRPGDTFPVIKNIFHITFVCNKGVAFGIFSEQASGFIWIFLTCIILIVLALAFYRSIFDQIKLTQIALALILVGAIGNLIDRIRFGYVVDFLDFRIWPVFNTADTAITIGTALLILQMLKQRRL